MTIAALLAFGAYLLGSVSGSLVVGRLRGGIDIRTQGSGNAGGTNALRTQGAAFAAWVVLIDVGKGWLAAAVLPRFAVGATLALPAACAFAAVVGHVFPVWHGFRGGKGVATLAGAVVGLAPSLVLPLLGVWLAMVALFGYVGLASITAVAALPVLVLALDLAPRGPLLAFGVASALFVVFTHRGNLARMREGKEPRARRLWLLGRLRP